MKLAIAFALTIFAIFVPGWKCSAGAADLKNNGNPRCIQSISGAILDKNGSGRHILDDRTLIFHKGTVTEFLHKNQEICKDPKRVLTKDFLNEKIDLLNSYISSDPNVSVSQKYKDLPVAERIQIKRNLKTFSDLHCSESNPQLKALKVSALQALFSQEAPSPTASSEVKTSFNEPCIEALKDRSLPNGVVFAEAEGKVEYFRPSARVTITNTGACQQDIGSNYRRDFIQSSAAGTFEGIVTKKITIGLTNNFFQLCGDEKVITFTISEIPKNSKNEPDFSQVANPNPGPAVGLTQQDKKYLQCLARRSLKVAEAVTSLRNRAEDIIRKCGTDRELSNALWTKWKSSSKLSYPGPGGGNKPDTAPGI